MKFYRTIALGMLSIVYAATIFGAEKAEFPYYGLGVDIPEVIEGFRGKYKQFVDDFFHKETAHIKPYSGEIDLHAFNISHI